LQGFLNTTEFPKRARFERALFLFERLMVDSGAMGFDLVLGPKARPLAII
jgi:hypothetical protein